MLHQLWRGPLGEIKRVKPMRQIEMAELMIAGNNYTSSYAKVMVLQTKPVLRLDGARSGEDIAPTREQMDESNERWKP